MFYLYNHFKIKKLNVFMTSLVPCLYILLVIHTDQCFVLLTGPQDHGWCNGYTCQKRVSLFHSIVATNKSFDIYFTSTSPQNMRLKLLNTDDSKVRSPARALCTNWPWGLPYELLRLTLVNRIHKNVCLPLHLHRILKCQLGIYIFYHILQLYWWLYTFPYWLRSISIDVGDVSCL